MYDFIKCTIVDTPHNHFAQLGFSEFITDYSQRVDLYSECSNAKTYYYALDGAIPTRENSFKIIEWSKGDKRKTYFEGSLHKFWHSGKNHADYDLEQVAQTIECICSDLRINAEQFKVHHIEIGVNVPVKFNTKSVIDSLVSYKGIAPNFEYSPNKYLKRFAASHHILKTYDKGLQNGLDTFLLRFEVKAIKMQYLHSKGIYLVTMCDLLNTQLIHLFGELLTETCKNLIVCDFTIKLDEITQVKKRELFLKGRNPHYWKELKEQPKKNSKVWVRSVAKFNSLVSSHSEINLKGYLQDKIAIKWNELCFSENTGFSGDLCAEIIFQFTSQNKIHYAAKRIKNVHFLPPCVVDVVKPYLVGKIENVHFLPVVKGKKWTIEQKRCLACGRNITGQKEGSVYCSELIYGKQGKKCRNKVSNSRRDQKRIYPINNLRLFDVNSSVCDA